MEREQLRLELIRLVYRPDKSATQILETVKPFEDYVLGEIKKVEEKKPSPKKVIGNPDLFQ